MYMPIDLNQFGTIQEKNRNRKRFVESQGDVGSVPEIDDFILTQINYHQHYYLLLGVLLT